MGEDRESVADTDALWGSVTDGDNEKDAVCVDVTETGGEGEQD